MPLITAYTAYSYATMTRTTLEAPDTLTATRLKRMMGHDAASWIFARLPRHEYEAKCSCHFCVNWKRRYSIRPDWMRQDAAWPEWYAWLRMDIGPKNARLALRGGEHFVIVAECDVRQWLEELFATRGRLGMLLTLPLMERWSTLPGDSAVDPDNARCYGGNAA